MISDSALALVSLIGVSALTGGRFGDV